MIKDLIQNKFAPDSIPSSFPTSNATPTPQLS